MKKAFARIIIFVFCIHFVCSYSESIQIDENSPLGIFLAYTDRIISRDELKSELSNNGIAYTEIEDSTCNTVVITGDNDETVNFAYNKDRQETEQWYVTYETEKYQIKTDPDSEGDKLFQLRGKDTDTDTYVGNPGDLLLLIASSPYAPATIDTMFSIRNGVQFGDSAADVKLKDEVFVNSEEKPYDDFFINPVTLEYSIKPLYPNSMNENVQLAGASTSLYYLFAESGLKEIKYVTSTHAIDHPSANSLENAYDILLPMLTEKYGKALSPNDPLSYVIKAPALGMSFDYTSGPTNWLVKYNDFYVKICLYCQGRGTDSVYFGLSYYMITNDELNETLVQHEKDINQIYNDINNSI